MKKIFLALCIVLGALSICAAETSVPAPQSQKFSLGVRDSYQWSDQSPIKDLVGFGIIGRMQLEQDREFGMGIDALSDDFDDPAAELGLAMPEGGQHPSAKIMADLISVWGQQNFDIGSKRFKPFVLAGLALASIHMETHKGQLEDGTQYDLRTNAGTEHIFMTGIGIRCNLVGGLNLETAIRGEYHLANWTIEDRVSGAYIAADDYSALAGYLGLNVEF